MNHTAKVSELKARLSGYLAQVRSGGTVTVLDRKTPIARIVPLNGDAGGLEVREAIDPAGLPEPQRSKLKKRIDVVALLRTDRANR